jgi:hypothetical protein
MTKTELIAEMTLCQQSVAKITEAFKTAPSVTKAEALIAIVAVDGWVARYRTAKAKLELLK